MASFSGEALQPRRRVAVRRRVVGRRSVMGDRSGWSLVGATEVRGAGGPLPAPSPVTSPRYRDILARRERGLARDRLTRGCGSFIVGVEEFFFVFGGELVGVELVVLAAEGEEVVVGALFDDSSGGD